MNLGVAPHNLLQHRSLKMILKTSLSRHIHHWIRMKMTSPWRKNCSTYPRQKMLGKFQSHCTVWLLINLNFTLHLLSGTMALRNVFSSFLFDLMTKMFLSVKSLIRYSDLGNNSSTPILTCRLTCRLQGQVDLSYLSKFFSHKNVTPCTLKLFSTRLFTVAFCQIMATT